MPKVKKPKTKQSQRQKQRQSVVVNVHQTRAPARRRATPARRSGGGGGGGVVSVPYPVYMNSPSDYAPIIHNLPAQYQQVPTPSLPVNTAPVPSLEALTYPTPTQLQTPTEDVRPLVLSVKKEVRTPMRLGIDLAELKQKISSPTKGLTPLRENKPISTPFKSNNPESPLISAIQEEKKKRELSKIPQQVLKMKPEPTTPPLSRRVAPTPDVEKWSRPPRTDFVNPMKDLRTRNYKKL